jgi:hypothetical protein
MSTTGFVVAACTHFAPIFAQYGIFVILACYISRDVTLPTERKFAHWIPEKKKETG